MWDLNHWRSVSTRLTRAVGTCTEHDNNTKHSTLLTPGVADKNDGGARSAPPVAGAATFVRVLT